MFLRELTAGKSNHDIFNEEEEEEEDKEILAPLAKDRKSAPLKPFVLLLSLHKFPNPKLFFKCIFVPFGILSLTLLLERVFRCYYYRHIVSN